MRAAAITALTGPDAVEIRDVLEPEPAPGRVCIDVHYAGVVFPDVAGVVRKDAGGFCAGDWVAAMPVVGGFAETVAIDTEMVFPLPESVFEKINLQV